MKFILMYITNIIPYICIILPIYCIFRVNYIKRKLNGKYKVWHEVGLIALVIFLIGIISQTIIPEFEFYNGKIKIAEFINTDRFNLVPFKIMYQTFIEVFRYKNISYFYISLLANILIFIPIGLLLPLLFEKYRNIKNTILFGIIFSLCIETTQIILPRATDIDDIILNAFGTLLGFGIFYIIKKYIPKIIEMTKAITILDLVKEENSNSKKKYALITGASSGIGYEMAIKLSKLGFNVIVVARRIEKLNELKKKCNTSVEIISLDLSIVENAYKLYEKTKNKEIEVVINNAGFGIFGEFYKTNLENELNMIDLNIKCLHVLTKLYLKDMIKKNKGYILNVSSSAAFMPAGPLMSTYYGTKSYVLMFTNSIYEEIKRQNKNVNISSLCLGPTRTNFNKNANIHASVNELDSKYVADIAIKGLFNRKRIIIPGVSNKLLKIFSRFVPDRLLIKLNYNIQKRKAS